MRHIISGAFLAAVLICGNALAASSSVRVEGGVPTSSGGFQLLAATVAFGDLDVSTNSGATTLLQRINAAAADVCTPAHSSRKWSEQQAETCRKRAVNDAVDEVGSPALTQAATQAH
jgi:UrcA family protein